MHLDIVGVGEPWKPTRPVLLVRLDGHDNRKYPFLSLVKTEYICRFFFFFNIHVPRG